MKLRAKMLGQHSCCYCIHMRRTFAQHCTLFVSDPYRNHEDYDSEVDCAHFQHNPNPPPK